MSRKEKITFAKVKRCLPFMHKYGRSHGQYSGSRLYKTCVKCGHVRSA